MGKERGVAIAVVMLLLMVIIGVTVASGLLTRQNYSTGSFREKTLQANYSVKAGISTALDELTKDPTWAPTAASPYKKYLDANGDVGFQIWLEGNNEGGSAPMTTGAGYDLQPGQASIAVRALVNGKVVTGGYGGAETQLILERPKVDFDYALFRTDPSGDLTLDGNSAQILSYDSNTGVPFGGLPGAPPPLAFQNARVRSQADVNIISTAVSGEVILPSTSQLITGAGGTYLSESRLDEVYLPRKFEMRDGPFGVCPNSGVIPPGDYDSVVVAPGDTITLVRGGEYYFRNEITLRDNVTINLTGPVTNGPVVLYFHGFYTGKNCRVNMPASGPPVPSQLQLYGVSQRKCSSILLTLRAGTEACFVASHPTMTVELLDNVKLYGAINGGRAVWGKNVELHYDEALLGGTFNVLTEWVLVSHGMR